MENNQFIIAINSLITQEKRGSPILFETRLPFFFLLVGNDCTKFQLHFAKSLLNV